MNMTPRHLTALLVAAGSLILAAPAAADTFTVTRTDDPIPGGCEAADCSLREAVLASNATAAIDDTVLVPASATPYRLDYEELTVPVNDEVEIRGAGASATVIEGDGKSILFTIATAGAPGAIFTGVTLKGGAGAIQNSGQLTLRAAAVEQNKRVGAGGGIQTNGPLTVESSYLGFNSTPGISGGAIQANAPVTITNSTLTRNSSGGDSAVKVNGALTLANSTVAYNLSTGVAPALSGSPLSARDSVFAANTNATGTLACPPGALSLGGNVEDGSSCANGPADRANVDPLLGTLATHGGPTPVYDLLAGSPAIDFALQCPPLDQRGFPRPQGAACDSGAYEAEPAPAPVTPSPPAGSDTELAMRFGKGKLVLPRKKRLVRVPLSCPAAEASPPCAGEIVLRTRAKVALGKRRARVRLGSAKFKLGAGKSRKIAVRLTAGRAALVRESALARRVLLVVRAEDAAGNGQLLRSRRAITVRR